jgi:hypothetical protein
MPGDRTSRLVLCHPATHAGRCRASGCRFPNPQRDPASNWGFCMQTTACMVRKRVTGKAAVFSRGVLVLDTDEGHPAVGIAQRGHRFGKEPMESLASKHSRRWRGEPPPVPVACPIGRLTRVIHGRSRSSEIWPTCLVTGQRTASRSRGGAAVVLFAGLPRGLRGRSAAARPGSLAEHSQQGGRLVRTRCVQGR